MIIVFPAAWGVALDVRRDPDVFSRDPRFVTRSVHDLTNGKKNSQVRNVPFSDRVFLAHICSIYRKTAARGSCNGNQRWFEVMHHEFDRNIPTRETDLLFDALFLQEIFT